MSATFVAYERYLV